MEFKDWVNQDYVYRFVDSLPNDDNDLIKAIHVQGMIMKFCYTEGQADGIKQATKKDNNESKI